MPTIFVRNIKFLKVLLLHWKSIDTNHQSIRKLWPTDETSDVFNIALLHDQHFKESMNICKEGDESKSYKGTFIKLLLAIKHFSILYIFKDLFSLFFALPRIWFYCTWLPIWKSSFYWFHDITLYWVFFSWFLYWPGSIYFAHLILHVFPKCLYIFLSTKWSWIF